MEINLTEEQTLQVVENEYINIKFGEYRLFLELDRDKEPWYFEIVHSRNGKTIRGYAHDVSELELLIPQKPHDPSYYHNDPLCPHCSTYMIYKFEHCPKCGQKLDWSE